MLKGQLKAKGVCAEHFPQGDVLHFITWCRVRAMILDALLLQSNVAKLPVQCLKKA